VEVELGKRLIWVRERLSLNLKEVSDGVDIPLTTYWNRENGRPSRKGASLEIFKILRFYSRLWAHKFKVHFPVYDGEEVKEINAEFILFGKSATLSNASKYIELIEEDFRAREIEYVNYIQELEAKLYGKEERERASSS